MIKQKTCKAPGCSNKFTQSRPFQTWCSFDCAIVLADIARKKREASKARIERKERREAKIKAKTRFDYLREAQASFNSFIRARDNELPCISCGRFHNGAIHAGHYRATSVVPALRFNEDNVHSQCAPCNVYKHGNLIEYRKGLIKRIGLDRVEWLEGPHEPKHYSIPELMEIKGKYSRLARELRKGRE